jgi:hypothetical protein
MSATDPDTADQLQDQGEHGKAEGDPPKRLADGGPENDDRGAEQQKDDDRHAQSDAGVVPREQDPWLVYPVDKLGRRKRLGKNWC